jgi:hypothetical protein
MYKNDEIWHYVPQVFKYGTGRSILNYIDICSDPYLGDQKCEQPTATLEEIKKIAFDLGADFLLDNKGEDGRTMIYCDCDKFTDFI